MAETTWMDKIVEEVQRQEKELWYVVATWEEFPDGGTYAQVVEAVDYEHAVDTIRWIMAKVLSDNDPDIDTEEFYNDCHKYWDICLCARVVDIERVFADYRAGRTK